MIDFRKWNANTGLQYHPSHVFDWSGSTNINCIGIDDMHIHSFGHSLLAATTFAVLMLSASASHAAGSDKVDYAADGKVAAEACGAHLTGKPPSAALGRAGFKVLRKNKTGLQYRKQHPGGLLPVSLIVSLNQKRKTPNIRSCFFMVTPGGKAFKRAFEILPEQPEATAVLRAIHKEFQARGYKHASRKTSLGRVDDYFIGKNATYRLQSSAQSGSVMLFVEPQ